VKVTAFLEHVTKGKMVHVKKPTRGKKPLGKSAGHVGHTTIASILVGLCLMCRFRTLTQSGKQWVEEGKK